MGEIYVALLYTFETNKAETSLVQSLNLGMTHMIGKYPVIIYKDFPYQS